MPPAYGSRGRPQSVACHPREVGGGGRAQADGTRDKAGQGSIGHPYAMGGGEAPQHGREAYASQRWAQAFTLLSASERNGPLGPEDTERLAWAAYLIGSGAWADASAKAHQRYLDAGDMVGATRCAFWTAFGFMNAGEMAHAGGWLARAQRIIEENQLDCAESGYLLLPAAIEGCGSDPGASLDAFSRAVKIGERFHDRDLVSIARHGQGRALIYLGEPGRGMSLLDELLVSLTAGELSPIVVGDIYCGVIEACQETFDVARAREWTAALVSWCAAQPELVPYRGQCLVNRSIVLQLDGDWADALDEAANACTRLTEPSVHPAVGAAYYQRAELHRLLGEDARAEEAYRRASEYGRDPQPGLAQLRLAQGQPAVAAASLRRALDEARDRVTRLRILPAAVEALVADGDIAGAREASDELSAMARGSAAPYVVAVAAVARAAVLLTEGDASKALREARQALAQWDSVRTPYEAARTRALIADACRMLGDADGAEFELQAARRAFESLGAAPDLARLSPDGAEASHASAGLTSRELDVLRLVAQGKTNRMIGDELVISEKTVARHLSNIFTKLELPSRAAATAYAYEHRLI